MVAALVAPEAVAAERVGMQLVRGAQRGDPRAGRLERDAVVRGMDPAARHARLLDQADDRGRGEEDRVRHRCGDRAERARVEVVGVLVGDADEVGGLDLVRAQRRAGAAA